MEADGADEGSEPREPGARPLLEVVEGLVKEAYMVGVVGVDEPGRLLAVDVLGEVTMQEGIVHVHLMNWPLACRCDRQNGVNCGCLDHRRERLLKINSRPLREPADHPPCFVAFQAPAGFEFVMEEPLPSDDVGSARVRDKTPCPVLDQRRVLNLHCS